MPTKVPFMAPRSLMWKENWGNRLSGNPKNPSAGTGQLFPPNVSFALASGDPAWVWLLSWIWNKDTITWGGIGKDQILTPIHRQRDVWSRTTGLRKLWCNVMGKEEDVWLKGKGQCVFEVRAVAYGTPRSFGKLRTHSKNIETFWQCWREPLQKNTRQFELIK